MIKFLTWIGQILLVILVASILLAGMVFLAGKFVMFKLFLVIAAIAVVAVLLATSGKRAANQDDGDDADF